MGLPRQEYWSGFSFPSLTDLPNPGIEPVSPALAGRFFTTEPSGSPAGSATEQKFFILMISSLLNFLFMHCAFGVKPKNFCLDLDLKDYK